jgi:S1-C subfamily serine protease
MRFSDEQLANPDELRIDVSDGLDESAEPRFYAKVVAVDGYLDVAVLKIRTKLSGAPTDDDDLAALSEVPLGDSDDLSTSDEVAFYGFPLAAGSAAPTFTNGVVAGPVQDDRLDEFRAVINTTAAISIRLVDPDMANRDFRGAEAEAGPACCACAFLGLLNRLNTRPP